MSKQWNIGDWCEAKTAGGNWVEATVVAVHTGPESDWYVRYAREPGNRWHAALDAEVRPQRDTAVKNYWQEGGEG